MKRLFLIVFLWSQWSFSQDLIHYSTENGLPHDVTYNIHSDDKGYMWFGTDDGLLKFNGKDFTVYTDNNGLETNYVIDVAAFSKDTLAVATWGGGMYLFSKGKFLKLIDDDYGKTSKIEVFKKIIYSSQSFTNIKYQKYNQWESKNYVFDTLKKYVSRIGDLNTFASNHTILDQKLMVHNRFVKQSTRANLKGVYELKDTILEERFSFLNNRAIDALAKLDNNLYVGSQKDSIYLFNNEKVSKKMRLNIQNEIVVKFLKFTEEKLLILATNGNGFKNAYGLDLKTQQLTNLRNQFNIRSTISDIALDFEKNLWITTNGEGIYQIPYNTFNVENILEDEEIFKLINYKGKKYGLSAGSIFEFDHQKLMNEFKLKGFGKSMSVINGRLIINSLKQSVEEEVAPFIHEEKGVFHYKDDQIDIYSKDTLFINEKRIVDKRIQLNKVYFKDNDYYLATNTGLFVLDRKTFELLPSKYEELKNIRVTDLEKQNDVLWISSSKGLFKLKDEKLEKISTGDGLLSDNIKDLLVSCDDRLWIATIKGLSVYDGQSFVNITKNENLLSNNINSIFEDELHNIWIASVKGISILDNESRNVKQIAPIIHVFENELGFSFDVISYSNSNNLFTQYQINNQPWKKSTTNFLDFKNFKEGDYTFKLRSKKPNSDWEYSKLYAFQVKVPLMQKTGFIVFLTILISLLVISLIYYQLKKTKINNKLLTDSILKQKELEVKLTRVRENIAEDFHDDLGNKLASITILTDMLSEKVTSTDSKNIVDQILNNSDSLYKGTKDFIWSLKNESDQIEEMVTYLSDFGEDFFEQLNIKFRIEKNIETDIKLPYYWSRHLILIFKEAMTNAAKHSSCNEATIEFNFQKDTLEITFKDNGVGFCLETTSYENGLKHIIDRAKKIGGEVFINSSNSGTEIKFKGIIYPK
ncbi:MAG: hypothetical protein JXR05_16620 [Flavobacteriaceae bacterium]